LLGLQPSAFGPLLRNVLAGEAVQSERTTSCSQGMRASNCTTPRRNWSSRVGTIHRPPPYQDGALPLSYARNELAPRRGFALSGDAAQDVAEQRAEGRGRQPEQARIFWLTARRYYRLSYRGMDSGAGFEPAWACCRRSCRPPPSTAWLSQEKRLAGMRGIEPRTFGFGDRCSAS
jgi:hypothetical protein